ncbi:hypothetical protein BZA05DRAFT_20267 [Tricharina praecox]|uniref:uncharacterized protein n=1 Tax=Tricharina praecox TaxID=43433 RepID=UPI00221E5D37|nr:uncharacterized protein BZA05DRAFT_20267 [Tricharina praecox]KAI5859041.1 hypothetical protein BZA05DRAFT_20267 [Tricharina praecox]
MFVQSFLADGFLAPGVPLEFFFVIFVHLARRPMTLLFFFFYYLLSSTFFSFFFLLLYLLFLYNFSTFLLSIMYSLRRPSHNLYSLRGSFSFCFGPQALEMGLGLPGYGIDVLLQPLTCLHFLSTLLVHYFLPAALKTYLLITMQICWGKFVGLYSILPITYQT